MCWHSPVLTARAGRFPQQQREEVRGAADLGISRDSGVYWRMSKNISPGVSTTGGCPHKDGKAAAE
jgi:hypothetical protein